MAEETDSDQPSLNGFEDMGIPLIPEVVDTAIGQVRAFTHVPKKERVYIVLMLVSILTASGFTIAHLTKDHPKRPDLIFGVVLLLNAVFCIWYVLEGVLRERMPEIVVLTIATVIIKVYIIVDYAVGERCNITLARLVVTCIFCPPLIILGLMIAKTYYDEKHLIFRITGTADETLQKLYFNLLVFQDLLKFDLQLGLSMVIFVAAHPAGINMMDIILLSVGNALKLAWFLLGYCSMSREFKIPAIIFFIWSPAELAYISWKIYDLSGDTDSFPGVAYAAIACGAVAILVRILVLFYAFKAYRKFGTGLKSCLYPNNADETGPINRSDRPSYGSINS